ncbi:signal peptidase I [Caproiciproducens sp. CPB-2]|uniref:signal peptidase I n=1 Tax=Caproiciproducens sp. CPB-2 TaxID=3030017 RepID=UPI0023DBF1C8|nr:signal peptidase I [Caproiciproducens sp. CPB-2]MDF1493272.1 signal peptidase I [Caproiciproducens sp. CPB-2]
METETGTVERSEPQKDSPKIFRKIFKAVGNVLFALLMILIAFMLFCMVRSKMTGGAPKIAGHYMLVVLSGSMAPQFDTGSVAFVNPVDAAEIKKGDIITFKGFAGSDQMTTHRVVGINQKSNGPEFLTKGDANHANDPDPIPGEDLIGRVSFTLPYLGYFMNFAQTRNGLLLLIIVPGALLLFFECHSLYQAYSNSKKQVKEESSSQEIPAQAVGKEER